MASSSGAVWVSLELSSVICCSFLSTCRLLKLPLPRVPIQPVTFRLRNTSSPSEKGIRAGLSSRTLSIRKGPPHADNIRNTPTASKYRQRLLPVVESCLFYVGLLRQLQFSPMDIWMAVMPPAAVKSDAILSSCDHEPTRRSRFGLGRNGIQLIPLPFPPPPPPCDEDKASWWTCLLAEARPVVALPRHRRPTEPGSRYSRYPPSTTAPQQGRDQGAGRRGASRRGRAKSAIAGQV
ncbi:hypothetical protein LY78DRAFT_228742 [Colletotrichum sublineola]|nr:hypothetical protein LY78DRAFT_228742 [Colletotrichum sublineola]